ncbi:MAG: ATP-binding protein [Bdellovibrionota bacterium]
MELSSKLIHVIQKLSFCHELDDIVSVLRGAARTLIGSDGITIILSEGDFCHYVEEDAIGPLWKGKRFPKASCVSGICMERRETIVIPDIYLDSRVPHEAYRPTFVQSLAVAPIRKEEPVGALGAYWAEKHQATPEELTALEALSSSAAMAFANVTLIGKLNAANAKKDEFISMLSHELRNPLAPIRNALYLLRRMPQRDPTVAYDIMERQVKHLVRIVDDLLDVSRITRGKIEIRKETIDVARTVTECVADREPMMQEKGIALKLSGLSYPVMAQADPTRLTQIVGNLLDNAIKFTPSGGSISIALAATPQEATIAIADTGSGIEADILPHVFDVFSQADRSLDRRNGGLGLGLSVVKGLAELHGGSVHAKSEGADRGSAFTVCIPRGTVSRTTRIERPALKGSIEETRVLLIEDHHDTAESLRIVLEAAGINTAVAYSGPEGIAAAQRFLPDVVVCDLGLPGTDGYSVASALRTNEDLKNVGLIAVTGYGREQDRDQALASGFDRHLVKPIEPEKLIAEIRVAAALVVR